MDQPPLVAPESEALAERCVDLCREGKAEDIRLFDVRKYSLIADFFLICSGNSVPHIRALKERMRMALAEEDLHPLGIDGDASSQWIVLDYGVIIVHILDPELREYYRIEELWEAGNLAVGPPQEEPS